MHQVYNLLPAIAAFTFVTAMAYLALKPDLRTYWVLPAVMCMIFLGWSAYTVAAEGPIGFWYEHTRNSWGNQIWFDLLLAAAVACALLVPRARLAGMNIPLWLTLVICTGSIGLLAMISRCLFLEHRNSVRSA